MKTSTLRADGLLLLAAIIWGAGFVAQKAGMEFIGPYSYTGFRFLIATVALLPLLLVFKSNTGSNLPKIPSLRPLILGGIWAGLAIGIGGLLQQVGINYTTASNAGFITSLYVILVPILGLSIGYRIRSSTWIGIVLAGVGLYFLSLYDPRNINVGDLLVLLGTVAWAAQVLIIGWATTRADPIRLTVLQTGVAAVVCFVTSIIVEGLDWSSIWEARWYLLYSGVLATSVAFTLQIIGQQKAPPAHAAMLLSLEAVFAAGAGYLFLGEILTGIQFLGCLLMLSGVLFSQVRRSEHRRFMVEDQPEVS